MTIQSNMTDDTLTITIGERFDFSSYQQFRDCYENLTAMPKRFIVDFLNATYLDSSALGMLLLLRDYGGGDDAPIELVNCKPDVRKILTISNFGQLFEIR